MRAFQCLYCIVTFLLFALLIVSGLFVAWLFMGSTLYLKVFMDV